MATRTHISIGVKRPSKVAHCSKSGETVAEWTARTGKKPVKIATTIQPHVRYPRYNKRRGKGADS